jgi:hypothetical protein
MRQRFVRGIGGTLRLTAPEQATRGKPSSATITLKEAAGTDLPTPVEGAAATVDATTGEMAYALAGAQAPDPLSNGYLYRATWRYVIDGVTYETDQLYEVRRRILKPTLTYSEVERDLPADVDDLCEGGLSEVLDAVGDAWDDVLDDLAARGYEPDKVMDPDRLRRPHRIWTLARLARAWGPSWRQYAADRASEYERAMSTALNAGDWYDTVPDAQKGSDEVKPTSVVCTR